MALPKLSDADRHNHRLSCHRHTNDNGTAYDNYHRDRSRRGTHNLHATLRLDPDHDGCRGYCV